MFIALALLKPGGRCWREQRSNNERYFNAFRINFQELHSSRCMSWKVILALFLFPLSFSLSIKNTRAFTPDDISFTRHFSQLACNFFNRPDHAPMFSEMRFRVIITSRNGPLDPRAFPSVAQSPLARLRSPSRSLWRALSSWKTLDSRLGARRSSVLRSALQRSD